MATSASGGRISPTETPEQKARREAVEAARAASDYVPKGANPLRVMLLEEGNEAEAEAEAASPYTNIALGAAGGAAVGWFFGGPIPAGVGGLVGAGVAWFFGK